MVIKKDKEQAPLFYSLKKPTTFSGSRAKRNRGKRRGE
jgi:hypothetical protein